MLLVFMILAVVTVCVTIVCAYFLLNAEDYRWWVELLLNVVHCLIVIIWLTLNWLMAVYYEKWSSVKVQKAPRTVVCGEVAVPLSLPRKICKFWPPNGHFCCILSAVTISWDWLFYAHSFKYYMTCLFNITNGKCCKCFFCFIFSRPY